MYLLSRKAILSIFVELCRILFHGRTTGELSSAVFPIQSKESPEVPSFFAMLRLSPNLIISAEHKHGEQVKAVIVIPALAGTQGSVPEGF